MEVDINEKILAMIERETLADESSNKNTGFFSKLFKGSDSPDLELVDLAKREVKTWQEKNYISPQAAEKLIALPKTNKFFKIFDMAQEIIKQNKTP